MAKTYEFIGGLHVPLKFVMDTLNYDISKELPFQSTIFGIYVQFQRCTLPEINNKAEC